MHRRPPEAKLRTMSVAGPVHVEIELHRTAGTISGRVAIQHGAPANFYGWLELIDNIEQATTGAEIREAPDQHNQQPQGSE
jgi:hypothetical protein